MPSEEAKRRKARRRAERKAERPKKQLQRWINLPKDLYSYETVVELPADKPAKETQAIIRQQQNLPWPIPKTKHPCRPWHPEDLWELGALKKSLFNELESCGSEVFVLPSLQDGKGKQPRRHEAENCLHHILCCWNTNLKGYDSAGPSFLVHILKRKYDGPLTFPSLKGEDNRTAWILRRAAPARSFHIILGQMNRTAYGHPEERSKHEVATSVQRSECILQNLVHAGGKDVSVLPRVSEQDLLNEHYFEDQEADKYDGRSTTSWTRTVLIIVPDEFIDDFIYENEASSRTSNDLIGQIESHQHEDHSGDESQDEADFECKDEEAMLERAHELSQRRLSSEERLHRDDPRSDVEVQDEHGNTYMMPASMFDISAGVEDVEEHQPANNEDGPPEIETVGPPTSFTRPHPDHTFDTERWSITRLGNNSLVRTRRHTLLG